MRLSETISRLTSLVNRAHSLTSQRFRRLRKNSSVFLAEKLIGEIRRARHTTFDPSTTITQTFRSFHNLEERKKSGISSMWKYRMTYFFGDCIIEHVTVFRKVPNKIAFFETFNSSRFRKAYFGHPWSRSKPCRREKDREDIIRVAHNYGLWKFEPVIKNIETFCPNFKCHKPLMLLFTGSFCIFPFFLASCTELQCFPQVKIAAGLKLGVNFTKNCIPHLLSTFSSMKQLKYSFRDTKKNFSLSLTTKYISSNKQKVFWWNFFMTRLTCNESLRSQKLGTFQKTIFRCYWD